MLPTELAKIAEETQKIEDELFKKPPEVPGEKPPETPPAEIPPAVTPLPAEKPPEEPPSEVPPVEAPPEAPPEIPPVEAPPPPEDFEHKYKVLQGKYNKEIKDLREKVREASDRSLNTDYERDSLLRKISDLTTRLEGLEKGKDPLPDKPLDTSSALSEMENDPDVSYVKEQFPDVWKAIKKVVSKSADGTVSKALVSRLENIEKKVDSASATSARSAKVTFDQYLDTNIEGWRTVNVDPEFEKWLQQTEPYTGAPKISLIRDAIANLDASRVARFFTDFATEKAVPKSDTDEVPPETPPLPVKPANLAPPKPRTAPLPKRPANTEIITTEYITEFYDKLRRGYYIGREAEGKTEEKRIEQAVSEGRVK
jgi:hypothetical protein